MAQSLAKNLIHLVFSTKNRERFIADAIRPHLHAYMGTVLKNVKSPSLLINSVEDHVHVLFSLHRTKALSDVVGDLKASSSKWIKTQSSDLATFGWQGGFGAFSISESNVPAVRAYIENQREHHSKVSFQDEMRAFLKFLKKHGVEYDERYLWD